MKKIVELRRMSNDQLKNRLHNIDPEIHRARMFLKKNQGQAPTESKAKKGQGTNTKFLYNLRKEKARILTILTERKNGWVR